MKQIYFLLYIALFFFFLSCEQEKDMSMSFDHEKVHPFETFKNEDGWYRLLGHTMIDTLVQYKKENSLRITPTLQEEDSLKQAFVSYYIDLTELEGKTMTLNGKYRYEDVENTVNTEVKITISQLNKEGGRLEDSILILPANLASQWASFTIKAPLDKNSPYAFVGISIQGNMNLWISNFQLMIDRQSLNSFRERKFAAEKDNEFDDGSNIELGELTPKMIENLEVLGKIWGFLKYYHPRVTEGCYNWDYELFRVLPDIVNAKNKEDRNKLLNRWVDKYGKIKETIDYRKKTGIKSRKEYNLKDKNIIYVDNIKSAEQNRNTVLSNMNSKGIIVDMRQYPHNSNQNSLFSLLSLKRPLWMSENDKSFPGNYHVLQEYDKVYETEKDPVYKGKIVILVDENTLSAGETWSMSYRLVPNSIIIGRQTAGANGNICTTYLPGKIMFTYTQLGAYYPNWEILQRKGVKIDIPVSPTVNDIKKGRDVWIEKAIEIIEGK